MEKKYEIPECEEIKVRIENNFLQTGGNTGGDVDPIGGGDDPGQ